MVDSIHAARWISLFADQEIDFVLFPSGPNRRIHPMIQDLVNSGPEVSATFKVVPFRGLFSLPLWVLDKFFDNAIRALLLKNQVRKFQPEYVHALEFQHAGYLTAKSLGKSSGHVTLIVTNYGSDIYWFQRFVDHEKKITHLLNIADRYSAECSRDYKLARKFGFTGLELPLIPNSGIIDQAQMSNNVLRASHRKIVVIKGYDGWVGRSGKAIEALRKHRDKFRDIPIIFFSCGIKTILSIWFLRNLYGLNVSGFGKNRLSHSQLLDLLSKARLYVGLSLSDGLSTSSIEAMAMGAFPLQTDTSCASEWFIDGKSGVSLKGVAEDYLANELLRSYADTRKLEAARHLNMKIVSDRFEEILESKPFLQFYT